MLLSWCRYTKVPPPTPLCSAPFYPSPLEHTPLEREGERRRERDREGVSVRERETEREKERERERESLSHVLRQVASHTDSLVSPIPLSY